MENQPRVSISEFLFDEDFEEFVFHEEEEDKDLSCWEIVNSSDADSDDSVINGFASWHSSISSPMSLENHPIENSPPGNCVFDHDDPDVPAKFTQFDVDEKQSVAYVSDMYYDRVKNDENYEDEDEDEDDDDDGYDLDDELVPWSVSGKFGRQRMRKLGKRGFARMNNSKRSPYLYVKPGCLHGKHGLGLKHSC